MGRTPLMRALQHLAREHETAARLGVDVEAIREGDGRVSRREFVKRAGQMGAVAVAAPAVFARPARAAGASRIAIVGGGIAGLQWVQILCCHRHTSSSCAPPAL